MNITTEEQRERIRRWVAALRSDEYKQAFSFLRHKLDANTDGYCCLGVACDLFSKETGHGSWDTSEPDLIRFVLTEEGTVAYEVLPQTVMEWLGLPETNPHVPHNIYDEVGLMADELYPPDTLAEANDSGLTFAQIADIIETMYLRDTTTTD